MATTDLADAEAATNLVADGKLRLTVLSPEVELLTTLCDFVALPAHEGELGVLPLHAPLVSRLGSGELRVRSGEKTDRYYVSGGYVQISANDITVLTEKAVDAAALDAAQLRANLEAAEAMPKATVEQVAARRAAIEEAKLQLAIKENAS